MPAAEIVAMLDEEFGARAGRRALPRRGRQALAATSDGAGEIGVIASVTQPFCGDCTRSRLSAEGKLYTCLFAVRGHDLRALIRGGATDEEIAAQAGQIWRCRGDRYSELRAAEHRRPCDRRAQGRDELHRRLAPPGSRAFQRGPFWACEKQPLAVALEVAELDARSSRSAGKAGASASSALVPSGSIRRVQTASRPLRADFRRRIGQS